MTDTLKQRGFEKLQHIKIEQATTPTHHKPKIRPSKAQLQKVAELKTLFKNKKLVTVCEEAELPQFTRVL